MIFYFFFSSRRRHTRCGRDWSSDVCSSAVGRMFDYFNKEQLDSLFTYTETELGFDEAKMRMAFGKMKPFVLLQLFTKDAFGDRKSTRLNSSHVRISYAVFCLK